MTKRSSYNRSTPADQMLTHRRAWRIDDSHFKLWARDSTHSYEVALNNDGSLSCNCPADAQFHMPTCWHRGAVARRLLREGIPDSVFQPNLSVVASDELPDDEYDEFPWPPAS